MSSINILLESTDRISPVEKSLVPETPKDCALQTEILTGRIEAIGEIYDEWTVLCEEGACNNPFLRPEWFTAFVKNFGHEILLVTIRRAGDGKLRAVLPLMRKIELLHGIPVRKLQAVFNLNTQRFDLIHGSEESEREEIVRALWNEIKRLPGWDVLEMRLVRKGSWLSRLLELAESENCRTGVWPMDGAPFAALPQGADKEKLIEEFFNGLKRSFRQDLKRRLVRLKEQGAVEFVVTRGYSPELLQKYFELEARSWKGRGGTAVTCDPKVAGLHDDFARAAAAETRNALFIYELKLDGKTIAMSLNIMYGRQTVFWKTSYDEDYKRFSPGNLLIREFLADAIRNDSVELDMLSPATGYKRVWASGEREHAALYVFRRGILGGLLWKWKFSLIDRLRKFKDRKLKEV
jgi:hypothetical protein